MNFSVLFMFEICLFWRMKFFKIVWINIVVKFVYRMSYVIWRNICDVYFFEFDCYSDDDDDDDIVFGFEKLGNRI